MARRFNLDPTFILIIVLLAGRSLREGAFTDPKTWIMEKIMESAPKRRAVMRVKYIVKMLWMSRLFLNMA